MSLEGAGCAGARGLTHVVALSIGSMSFGTLPPLRGDLKSSDPKPGGGAESGRRCSASGRCSGGMRRGAELLLS